MLMLVLGDSLLLTFLGWEGVGACSYFLIAFWHTDPANAPPRPSQSASTSHCASSRSPVITEQPDEAHGQAMIKIVANAEGKSRIARILHRVRDRSHPKNAPASEP